MFMGENERKVIEAIKKIVDSGSNAEVKRRKDGTLVVYEVKKNIVASWIGMMLGLIGVSK